MQTEPPPRSDRLTSLEAIAAAETELNRLGAWKAARIGVWVLVVLGIEGAIVKALMILGMIGVALSVK